MRLPIALATAVACAALTFCACGPKSDLPTSTTEEPARDEPTRTAAPIQDAAAESPSPSELAAAFIADYETWNTDAWTIHEEQDAMARTEEAYGALIAKYCRPGFRHQPIAYGSSPQHAPTVETVVSEETSGDTSIVRTKHTDTSMGFEMVSDYEYHFTFVDGRWFLTSLLYVDDDGTYEGL